MQSGGKSPPFLASLKAEVSRSHSAEWQMKRDILSPVYTTR
ncbi:TPA: DUF4113 domain-containing protein [Escherichia coli]